MFPTFTKIRNRHRWFVVNTHIHLLRKRLTTYNRRYPHKYVFIHYFEYKAMSLDFTRNTKKEKKIKSGNKVYIFRMGKIIFRIIFTKCHYTSLQFKLNIIQLFHIIYFLLHRIDRDLSGITRRLMREYNLEIHKKLE